MTVEFLKIQKRGLAMSQQNDTQKNDTQPHDAQSTEALSIGQSIISKIFPDPQDCLSIARDLASQFPAMTRAQLSDRAIKKAKLICASTGGGLGMLGSPMTALPAATADIVTTLKQEAKMIGVIAAIFDPESVNDIESFHTDILAILFPSAATQALSVGGFVARAGQATTKTLIRRYIKKDVLKSLVRFAAKYLGLKLTQKALLTKAVPLVGGIIGATWNWLEVQRVGKRAIAYYNDQSSYR
jgi:hypothetical protein